MNLLRRRRCPQVIHPMMMVMAARESSERGVCSQVTAYGPAGGAAEEPLFIPVGGAEGHWRNGR